MEDDEYRQAKEQEKEERVNESHSVCARLSCEKRERSVRMCVWRVSDEKRGRSGEREKDESGILCTKINRQTGRQVVVKWSQKR